MRLLFRGVEELGFGGGEFGGGADVVPTEGGGGNEGGDAERGRGGVVGELGEVEGDDGEDGTGGAGVGFEVWEDGGRHDVNAPEGEGYGTSTSREAGFSRQGGSSREGGFSRKGGYSREAGFMGEGNLMGGVEARGKGGSGGEILPTEEAEGGGVEVELTGGGTGGGEEGDVGGGVEVSAEHLEGGEVGVNVGVVEQDWFVGAVVE